MQMSGLPWDKKKRGNLEALGFQVQPLTGSRLDYALNYASLGWPVLPLHAVANGQCTCGQPQCSSPGKHPRTQRGLHDASTDRETITAWFDRWPDANIGVATGARSGFWALDVDVKGNGLQTLEDLTDRHGPFPDTPMAITGSGGQHWLFRHVDGLGNKARFLPGLDVRGEGGYIAVEPSIHLSGNAYAWEASSDPTDGIAVAEAPQWLLDLVNVDKPKAADRPASGSAILEGGRNNALASLAGGMRRDGMSQEAIEAALQAENAKRCSPPLPSSEVARIAWSIARKEPAQDYGELAQVDTSQLLRGLKEPPAARIDLNDWTSARYAGAAPERRWLVRDVLPLGVPVMVASMGGAGKSLKLLDLAFKVAIHDASAIVPLFSFGKPIDAGGTAVMFCAEDDAAEIHRRLNNLDPHGLRFAKPGRLRVIPLPDIGGPMPLVTMAKGEPAITQDFYDLRDQLQAIDDLRLVVFDPLQALVAADVNADPAIGQFFCTVLARLAAETGCTVVATHHMRKPSKPITSPQEARDAIRGTTALVDGMRATYAIWGEDDPERIAKARAAIGDEDGADVFAGAVVKANFPVDKHTRTYLRDPGTGLLTDVTTQLFTEAPKENDLLEQLFESIKAAAASGHPYTKSNSGAASLIMRRHELPPDLASLGRKRLYPLVDQLLADERLVTAKGTSGSDPKWLDVPGGRFAIGLGEVKPGAYRRAKK